MTMNEGTKHNVLDLPKILKIAREHTIIGYYESSINKYNISLGIIQSRYKELTEEFLKQKWKITELNVKKEMEQTKQMLEICQTLKNEYFDYQKKQIEPDHISKRRMKEKNIIAIDMTENSNSKKSQPNIGYFGKKPFAHGNQDVNDPFENVNMNVFQSLGEGVSINMNYENSGVFNNEKKKIIAKKSNSNQIFKNNLGNNQRQSIEPNQGGNKMSNPIKSFKVTNSNNNDIQDSVINPLEAFNLSNTNINNLNITNTTIMGNNTSYMNEIDNFIGNGNGFQKKQRNNNNCNRMGMNLGSYNNNNNVFDNINPFNNGMNQISEQPEFIPKKPKTNAKKNPIHINPEPRKKAGFKEGKVDPKGKNKSKGNAPKSMDKESVSKSKFLQHHYPNGSGPDTDLIEMLEREVIDTNPNVSFEDIAELDNAKNALQEAVLLPLLIPKYFQGIRRPWKGILLYGPPGTGKTMLAKALATKGKTTFFNVHSSSFASKWRGESEKLVRILFEMARFYAPTTIFIDEVDSLCSKRGESSEGEGSRRVKAEILVQMDGISSLTSNNSSTNSNANANNSQSVQDISKNSEINNGESNLNLVTVMAATNRPWDLDEALRRRFEKRIYIPLPNIKGREELFKIHLRNIKLTEGVNYSLLVDKTNGYSGSDISNVCREAAFMPMRRNWEKNKNNKSLEEIVSNPKFREDIDVAIDMKDLVLAINNISKSVSKNDLVVYDNWTKEFGAI